MTATLEQIEEMVRCRHPDADLSGLDEAYAVARAAHEGQVRLSGEQFLAHPVEVCMILAELHMDTATLKAALLHDVVEDSAVTLDDIRTRFGDEVADLVDGVTKIGKIKFESLAEKQSNNLRKMLIAMAKDIRVIIIKLADRLHNMRTISALPEEKAREKAVETLEIYAPLAHRLGMSSIKWELEDLAFQVLDPSKYEQVAKLVDESREAREAYLADVIRQLHDVLSRVGIEADIGGRPKHLHSIHQKMQARGKDFSGIYDLIAIRIIVEDVQACYAALGQVHTTWTPVPNRFKDYVAMPKFNMYQSLHTTVIGPSGKPLEIQIRSKEMHRVAEYGVAAHWRYKERAHNEDGFEEGLAWLRQMLEWQTELKDPGEFMEAFKVDLFEDEVLVFTPNGDVISLRKGSTPLDFAYAIHTEVGNHCVGAKINGSIVSLSYELQMGDRIEILTNKNATPSRDWLNIVRTSSARSKIRAYFSKTSRHDDAQTGRDELAKVMRKNGLGIASPTAQKALDEVARELNYAKTEDLFAAIGAGKLSSKLVSTRLLRRMQKEEAAPPPAQEELPFDQPMAAPRAHRRGSTGGVVVPGVDGVLTRISRCCNPVPGDDIVGFVTRGRGVTVHRRDCPNAAELLGQPERLLQVEWDQGTNSAYHVEIWVEAADRLRLLQDVTAAVSGAGTNILSASVTTQRDGLANMRFLIELSDIDRLQTVLKEVRGVNGVFEARRMQPGEASKRKRS